MSGPGALFVSGDVERPELWEAMQIAELRSGHEGFRRDRFIQLG